MLFLHKNMSLGVHLLYALLCGRPVVVLAEPCNERFVTVKACQPWDFRENQSMGHFLQSVSFGGEIKAEEA